MTSGTSTMVASIAARYEGATLLRGLPFVLYLKSFHVIRGRCRGENLIARDYGNIGARDTEN